jgi:MOSC domain-containing protein YiiM
MAADLELSGYIFQINLSNGGVPKLGARQGMVTALGLAGDQQRNTEVHGGPNRALCLYSLERIQALQREGHPIFPGAAGENLTLADLPWELITPGLRLKLGDQVIIELTQYTTPCINISESFICRDSTRISQDRHPGWSRLYARVLQMGAIRVGDRVTAA